MNVSPALAAAGGVVASSLAVGGTAALASQPGRSSVPALVVGALAIGVALDAAWRSKRGAPRAFALGLGAGAVGVGVASLAAWSFGRGARASDLLHASYGGVPAPSAPPPSSGPSRQPQWQAFLPEAGPVPLMPGIRYRAAIDLPWGVGALVTDGKVREKASELGFSDVVIAHDAPPGWPEVDGADLFVEATYAGAPRWLERHERIVGAWAYV